MITSYKCSELFSWLFPSVSGYRWMMYPVLADFMARSNLKSDLGLYFPRTIFPKVLLTTMHLPLVTDGCAWEAWLILGEAGGTVDVLVPVIPTIERIVMDN